MDLKVNRLASSFRPTELPLPTYQTTGAAGADLYAALEGPVSLSPGERVLVPTGIALELPIGFEAQVRPRSGLALRHGVTTLNAPGTIDSDYRGEIGVILVNHGQDEFVINRGDRIAQLVVASVYQARFVEVSVLSDTERITVDLTYRCISKGQE